MLVIIIELIDYISLQDNLASLIGYLIIDFQLLSEFRGENGFLRRLGPGGLGSGSLKLKNVQKSINTVELALRKRPGSLR